VKRSGRVEPIRVAIHKCMEAKLGISGWGEGRGQVKGAQTMYTHVSKCKNDKIKGEKDFSHCSRYIVVPYYCLNLQFPNDIRC
jgi:hypothetical protein